MDVYQINKNVSIIKYIDGNGNAYNTVTRKSIDLNNDVIKIITLLQKYYLQDITKNLSEDISSKISKIIDELVNSKVLTINQKDVGFYREEKISPALKSIQLEVTRRCNLRCQHCYLADYSGKDELSTNEIFNLIDQASDIGVSTFHITGGEPLVRKDIKDILIYIKNKGLYGQLYTNATLLNDEFIEFLNTINISVVKISLDGFNPETHDQFRRAKNSHHKAITAIQKLKKANIPVEIGSVINKVNIKEAQQLIDFIKDELKLNYHIDSFVPVGQGLKNEKITEIDDWEYVNAMKDEISVAYHRSKEINKEIPVKEDKSKYFYCGAGNSYVFITSRGIVKFCPSMSDEINGGSLRENSLKDIWLKGKAFTDYRDTNCKYIKECPHFRECKGGCRSRSISKYGGMTEPDLESCRMFYAITKIKSPGLIEYEKNKVTN